ncbi:MAG: hypothetical protein AABY22_25405, partial [Nanoarchaeota archaeon]
MKLIKTNPKLVVYLVGALKNKNIPIVANKLRKVLGKEVEIFSSWYHSSPDADSFNLKCCKERGLDYKETLLEYGSRNSYDFDKKHLTRAHVVVGLMKFGRSGMLELGWSLGKGKKGYILFPSPPERCDIMLNFLDNIFFNFSDLIKQLKSRRELRQYTLV